jgi:hypothetical protein
MTGLSPQASLEEVLESFSIEHDVGKATLQKYLAAFPEFSNDLIDLSRQIARVSIEDEAPLPLAESERRLINSAVTRIQTSPGKTAVDPFADIPAQEMRHLAKSLNLPRQVIMAFKERNVIAESVPQKVMISFAEKLQTSVQHLFTSLKQPHIEVAGSYKSNTKPGDAEKITFEQLLRDADWPEDDISHLMEED